MGYVTKPKSINSIFPPVNKQTGPKLVDRISLPMNKQTGPKLVDRIFPPLTEQTGKGSDGSYSNDDYLMKRAALDAKRASINKNSTKPVAPSSSSGNSSAKGGGGNNVGGSAGGSARSSYNVTPTASAAPTAKASSTSSAPAVSKGSGATIKSLKTAKNQLNDLKSKMINYARNIDVCNEALNKMMKGDGTNAYWQGQNALDWYTSATKKLTVIINNYANSYAEFADYARICDRATAKNSVKGLKKSMLARFDGSVYTNGVAKNKNDKMISTIPSTVNADSVNDDQTRESYACYTNLKDALTKLSSCATGMINTWDAVAKNTKGKMNADAKKRARQMNNRKRSIDNCIASLETEYIGDILFSD